MLVERRGVVGVGGSGSESHLLDFTVGSGDRLGPPSLPFSVRVRAVAAPHVQAMLDYVGVDVTEGAFERADERCDRPGGPPEQFQIDGVAVVRTAHNRSTSVDEKVVALSASAWP